MVAPAPELHGRSPAVWKGLLAGFAIAVVASGGIVLQRLTRGDVKTALFGHVLLTITVLAVMCSDRELEPSSFFSPRLALQVVGATTGIVVAHCLLRASKLGAVPWLSERPGQFVNDAVAVFAPLAIVWAAKRRPPNTVVLVSTLTLVTAYRATGSMWHLDTAAFSYTVQDFVTGELAGSALGIATFRLLMPT